MQQQQVVVLPGNYLLYLMLKSYRLATIQLAIIIGALYLNFFKEHDFYKNKTLKN